MILHVTGHRVQMTPAPCVITPEQAFQPVLLTAGSAVNEINGEHGAKTTPRKPARTRETTLSGRSARSGRICKPLRFLELKRGNPGVHVVVVK